MTPTPQTTGWLQRGWIIAPSVEAGSRIRGLLNGLGDQWLTLTDPSELDTAHSNDSASPDVVVFDLAHVASADELWSAIETWNLDVPAVLITSPQSALGNDDLPAHGSYEIVRSNGNPRSLLDAIDRLTTPQITPQERLNDHQRQVLFERSPIPFWVEDLSDLVAWFDELRADGVTDLDAYLADHPDSVRRGIELIRVIDVNPAGVRMTGAPDKATILKTGLAGLYTDDSHEAFLQQLMAVWNGDSTARILCTGKTLEGDRLDYIVTWVAASADPNRPDTIVVSMEDVTELTEARLRMQRLSALKDEFIDSISHELRTPLTAILGFAGLLRELGDKASPEDLDEFLALLECSAEQGSAILDNMLVAVHLDSEGNSLAPLSQQTEPVDLLTETNKAIRTITPDNRSRIDIAPFDIRVCGDRSWVRQIIRNLLTNAIQHGGPHVSIKASVRGSTVEFAIGDDGEGIAHENLKRAFARFESSTSYLGLTRNLGLGLTVSRALAQAMGGDLRYMRSSNTTVFILTLPRAEDN